MGSFEPNKHEKKMKQEQLTKEKEFAIKWVLENAANYAFVPDMLVAFAEHLKTQEQGSKLPMHVVSKTRNNKKIEVKGKSCINCFYESAPMPYSPCGMCIDYDLFKKN